MRRGEAFAKTSMPIITVFMATMPIVSNHCANASPLQIRPRIQAQPYTTSQYPELKNDQPSLS
jgi:hypothetical protein